MEVYVDDLLVDLVVDEASGGDAARADAVHDPVEDVLVEPVGRPGDRSLDAAGDDTGVEVVEVVLVHEERVAGVRQAGDALAIGVLHTNVGGRPDHEPYAPCSLDDLRAARMDYWALGHIHKPEVLAERPVIAYSGCTQGLSPNESGLRGCRIVTLDASGAASEFVPTSSVVWAREAVDATDLTTAADVALALAHSVEQAAHAAEDRHSVLRIDLIGRSAAHGVLARPGALRDLLADVRAGAMERDPWVWVDRITDLTRPAFDVDTLRDGVDFAGDLVRLTDDLLADDRRLLALVESAAGPVLSAMDTRDAPALDAADLLERARDLALDRMLAEEDR